MTELRGGEGRRRVRALAVAALAALFAAPGAGAAPPPRSSPASANDDQLFMGPEEEERGLVIRWRQIPGTAPEGHRHGYFRVLVDNAGSEERRVEIWLETSSFGGQTPLETRVERVVPAGASVRLFLPFPSAAGSAHLRSRVDGSEWSSNFLSLGGRMSPKPVIALHVGGRGEVDVADALQDALAGTGPVSVVVYPVTADDLPDRAMLLSAIDLIAVDVRDEGLEHAHEQVLVDWCESGGVLALLGRAPGPERPLGKLVRGRDRFSGGAAAAAGGSPGAAGFAGLGAWALFEDPALLRRPDGTQRAALARARTPPLDELVRYVEAPEIPGLGEVPVPLFVGVVIAFILLVGPINVFVVVRRYKRPTLALVFAPIAGLALTVAILVYGLVADGLGVRGSAVTLTLLDQVERRATHAGARLYYAAFAPRDGLAPGAGTTVTTLPRGDEMYPGARFDISEGFRVDALPARTPTPLFVVTTGPARERLRFQRVRDEYVLLADPALQPLGPGSLVLRAPDGRFFELAEADRMRPLVPAEAVGRVQAMLQLPEGAAVFHPSFQHAMWMPELALQSKGVFGSLEGWLSARTRVERALALAPGTYLARVARPPGFDTLGLEDVEEERAHHLVLGALGEDDFLD